MAALLKYWLGVVKISAAYLAHKHGFIRKGPGEAAALNAALFCFGIRAAVKRALPT